MIIAQQGGLINLKRALSGMGIHCKRAPGVGWDPREGFMVSGMGGRLGEENWGSLKRVEGLGGGCEAVGVCKRMVAQGGEASVV